MVEKCLLEEFRIPEDQVVRATGEDRGLDGVDVLSKDCPIRYIITVIALKEGWDCPFAYILCTVAEQSSKTAVEQILGRVMRLPKARKKTRQELNIAYAFAASQSFDEAAKTLQDGLVQNGFERQEARDLVAPLSEPQIELFGLDRHVEAPPVAKVLEAPYKPIPPFLSDKVVYNPDVGSIAFKEYLSPEEEEQLKGCFSTEESKKEIGKLCIYVREKGEYERLSPAERGYHSRYPSSQSNRRTYSNNLRRPILIMSGGPYLLTTLLSPKANFHWLRTYPKSVKWTSQKMESLKRISYRN